MTITGKKGKIKKRSLLSDYISSIFTYTLNTLIYTNKLLTRTLPDYILFHGKKERTRVLKFTKFFDTRRFTDRQSLGTFLFGN